MTNTNIIIIDILDVIMTKHFGRSGSLELKILIVMCLCFLVTNGIIRNVAQMNVNLAVASVQARGMFILRNINCSTVQIVMAPNNDATTRSHIITAVLQILQNISKNNSPIWKLQENSLKKLFRVRRLTDSVFHWVQKILSFNRSGLTGLSNSL